MSLTSRAEPGMPVTQKQMKAALQVTLALAEAIRDLGEVPSGTLYNTVMDTLSLDQYQRIIALLKKQGLITDTNHLLVWVGPK